MSNVPQEKLLRRDSLPEEDRLAAERVGSAPVKVLQVGEGNFLRGFFDWMIGECREKGGYDGSVAVSQPRRSGSGKLAKLKKQDGLYTLIVRGLEEGVTVERSCIVKAFSTMIDPYEEWDRFLALADEPQLEAVVSNTTEAGLVYKEEPWVEGAAPETFPAKLARLLLRRFERFGASAERGLIMLPTELIDRNGDALKAAVLRHSRYWGLPENFVRWVQVENRFLNSLVDRIVPGYPEQEAEAWFERLGYRDELLTTAEPYYFWAIEAESALEEKLPFRRSGLNVEWVADLEPYRLRKVRILNGAHTAMAAGGLLHGYRYVGEIMEDAAWSTHIRETVEREIIPSLPLERDDLTAYMFAVFERYRNPFLQHRLSDIAMNSLSKFKARLLPTIEYYASSGRGLPERLLRAFAYLLRYYQVRRSEEGFVGATFAGETYLVRDDESALEEMSRIWAEAGIGDVSSLKGIVGRLLALDAVWGKDLNGVAGLTDQLTGLLENMEKGRTE
jgi:tagaturonate reductase